MLRTRSPSPVQTTHTTSWRLRKTEKQAQRQQGSRAAKHKHGGRFRPPHTRLCHAPSLPSAVFASQIVALRQATQLHDAWREGQSTRSYILPSQMLCLRYMNRIERKKVTRLLRNVSCTHRSRCCPFTLYKCCAKSAQTRDGAPGYESDAHMPAPEKVAKLGEGGGVIFYVSSISRRSPWF